MAGTQTEMRTMWLFGRARSPEDAVYRNAFRVRRMAKLVELIDGVIAHKGSCAILDLGGAYPYWDGLRAVWAGRNVAVTLVNMYPQTVDDPAFTTMIGDACDLSSVSDNAFDIVHSNSVIEHVGSWFDKRRMAAEIHRLAPIHFVQTPNYWFPLEPHFRAPIIHWLPRPLQRRWVMSRKLGFFNRARDLDEAYRTLADSTLLDEAEMRALFPDSTLLRERFLFLVKSFTAVRAPARP